MKTATDSASSADRPKPSRPPRALLVGSTKQYGSEAPWYTGVVLQQACQAMIRGGSR